MASSNTTDDNHSKARINSINSKQIKKLFKSFDVLVVAGFQGISRENRITTLGRGGSDTTAVALAVATNLIVVKYLLMLKVFFPQTPG